MQRFILTTISLLSLFLTTSGLRAQSSDPLIYTVGKAFDDGPGKITYLLWQPGDPAVTFGKRFAIYRKSGPANSPDPYQLLGKTQLQTSPAATHALLKLGDRFDFNANQVSPRINVLYTETINENGSQADVTPHVPGLPEAKKLSYLINIAANDRKVLERLFFLGRAHPGVYMALGHGFAIKSANSTFTYEVRLVDAVGNDLRVIGRVTLDPAHPTMLTPTSRPFPVPHPPKYAQQEVASPLDHLVARLRWGMSDAHRRLFPHTFGYNLYRVKESVALAQGWNTTPPSPATMEAMVSASHGVPNPEATRVNTLPLMVSKIMTEAEASDLASEPDTFFTHDDKDPPLNPFKNGDTYYYFVAPRDIAGHPGPLSPGTRVVLCDRIPPVAPSIESITNVYASASPGDLKNQKSNQHLKIRIKQTPELPAKDAASRYLIYRWTFPTQHIRDGGDVTKNLAGVVDHVPGSTFVDWEDTGPDAPKITPTSESQFGRTWWYTIRAEDNAACNPKNLSGHSAPAFGVLRDRAGPVNPSGLLMHCRYLPQTTAGKDHLASKKNYSLPNEFIGMVVEGNRDTRFISAFDLEVLDSISGEPAVIYRSHQMFSRLNQKNVIIPLRDPDPRSMTVRVRCQTVTGLLSEWASLKFTTAAEEPNVLVVAPFDFSTEKYCFSDEDPLRTPPPHDVISPTGKIVGPSLTFTVPKGVAEYRIYRRVGHDGAYEMLERGSADNLPNPLPGNITFTDPSPPTQGGVEVCYFIQVFDENGNAGARVKIGCVTITTSDLAIPMLSEATYLSESNGSGQVQLKWFCDPVSVERFEIWVASDTTANPQVSSSVIGPKLDTYAGVMISDDLGSLTFVGFQTKTIASGRIGSGAEFSAVLSVPSSQSLTFVVRAVGKGPYRSTDPSIPARAKGGFSNVISASWNPPAAGAQEVIPWPALAVPNVADIAMTDITQYQKGEGPFYAVKLEDTDTHSSAILMGVFSAINSHTGTIAKSEDPTGVFFSFRKQNISPVPAGQIESVIPFAVYRYQLPSSLYPNATPNIVQVSPLIDRLAYGLFDGNHRIMDPFFRLVPFKDSNDRVLGKLPVQGYFSRDKLQYPAEYPTAYEPTLPYIHGCNTMIWWLDPMPVARGAKYQYLIVHFTVRGEIDRVIPTNYVQH